MHRILFAVIVSTFLLSSGVLFQSVFGQTKDNDSYYLNEEKINLRNDSTMSDIVAYVEVKEKKLVDSIGNSPDCDNDKGAGYCRYLLKAEVKEVFKGKNVEKTIEFYTNPDADYPKKYLLGEKIVFLVKRMDEKTGEEHLSAFENSMRGVNVLEIMRNISNPQSPINENDEYEIYSLKSIRKSFREADAVIYADVTDFKSYTNESGNFPFTLSGKIIEVFKGKLKKGQPVDFNEDLTYRPIRNEDLGKQIVFLEKKTEDGNISYERIGSTPVKDENDALKKLRKISKGD
ncbi:MAG: hypothetical protein ABIP06_08110 [Pyrinomonadaceae bacterium]